MSPLSLGARLARASRRTAAPALDANMCFMLAGPALDPGPHQALSSALLVDGLMRADPLGSAAELDSIALAAGPGEVALALRACHRLLACGAIIPGRRGAVPPAP